MRLVLFQHLYDQVSVVNFFLLGIIFTDRNALNTMEDIGNNRLILLPLRILVMINFVAMKDIGYNPISFAVIIEYNVLQFSRFITVY